MGWDEVCIICGIRPYSGPAWFCSGRDQVATEIAKEILDAGLVDLPAEGITSTLLKAFSTDSLDVFDRCYKSAIDLGYDHDCIAIGYFDGTGGYVPCNHHGRTLHPTGDDVQIRRVCTPNGGIFSELIEFDRGQRIVAEQDTSCDTYWASDEPTYSVWVHVACWTYLQEWLDCSLPPRIGRSGLSFTLAGELYEITGSRHERQTQVRGWLPCVDYGGTLDAYMDVQYQDYIMGPRKGSRHIAQALSEGLRDEQLIPAIMKDSRFWMFTRPDM
ncbi:uncharacterized protein PHACADRAFT_255091 [Phanerochaete carnosa HHB-10118-sp]|uniref:Uncharacterized protein n=1 Tax=Phanerochaete carnosa (strain HHB-10118-sp) TaxID=650164 RepID=K5WE96_PHACS|nr:uncharacterized protein PHACADRAFT_255091 [Phanerochaete carnosa HHB-10118-sp]EKM57369.1 hypothetical protein PHACADRAFT_255091 [Phanerochaete carnosa HHB-10118-sp]